MQGAQNGLSLAGPVGEHDREVDKIHRPILINIRDRIRGLPVEEEDREVDQIDLTVTVKVGTIFEVGIRIFTDSDVENGAEVALVTF